MTYTRFLCGVDTYYGIHLTVATLGTRTTVEDSYGVPEGMPDRTCHMPMSALIGQIERT